MEEHHRERGDRAQQLNRVYGWPSFDRPLRGDSFRTGLSCLAFQSWPPSIGVAPISYACPLSVVRQNPFLYGTDRALYAGKDDHALRALLHRSWEIGHLNG